MSSWQLAGLLTIKKIETKGSGLFDWRQPTNRPAIPIWWPVVAWIIAIAVTFALASGEAVALLVVGACSMLVLAAIARRTRRRKESRPRDQSSRRR